MLDKPRLFIGASSESRHVAEALLGRLGTVASVTFWEDAFVLGQSTLAALINAARSHEFAVFVFAPDDKVTSRGLSTTAPRDNVVFELGLFCSQLGPERVFVVKAEGESVKVPSDFAGITYATYVAPDVSPSNQQWTTAIRTAARRIETAIESVGA